MGISRIVERSLWDNGMNASIIAPKTVVMDSFDSCQISENAYCKIWEYRELMPTWTSCIVSVIPERMSWRRLFGIWCSDPMNLAKVEA